MRNRDRIIVYLASKASKCASYSELLDMLTKTNAVEGIKDPRLYLFKLLSRMASRGEIRRSWISISGRKKRIYCLRWGD